MDFEQLRTAVLFKLWKVANPLSIIRQRNPVGQIASDCEFCDPFNAQQIQSGRQLRSRTIAVRTTSIRNRLMRDDRSAGGGEARCFEGKPARSFGPSKPVNRSVPREIDSHRTIGSVTEFFGTG